MFLRRSPLKVVQRIQFNAELMQKLMQKGKSLKIFFSETSAWILMVFSIDSLYVTLNHYCPNYDDISKNMAAKGRGCFSLYMLYKNFKDLLR